MEPRRELQLLDEVWHYYEKDDIKYKTLLNQAYETTSQLHLKLYFFMQLDRFGCFSIPNNEDPITAGKNLEKKLSELIKQLNEKPNKNAEELAVALLANFYTEHYMVGLELLIAFMQHANHLKTSPYFKKDICEILYCLSDTYFLLPEKIPVSEFKDHLFHFMKIESNDDLSLKKIKLNLLFTSLSPLTYTGRFFYIKRKLTTPCPGHGSLQKIADHLEDVIRKSPQDIEIFPETLRQMDKKGIRERLKDLPILYRTLYGVEKKPLLSYFWRKSLSVTEPPKPPQKTYRRAISLNTH